MIKRKNYNKNIVLVVAIITCILIIIGIACFVKYQNRDKTKEYLTEKGYNETEINIIVDKLNTTEIDRVINMEYDKNLTSIISNKYYIPANFLDYLEYAKKEDDIDKAISIINTGANKEWYFAPKQVENTSNTMLVNKFNFLSSDYNPDDIVSISNWYAYEGHSIKKEVHDAYVKMWKAAKNLNLTLIVNSSFRTYDEQTKIYANSNDQYAARPGFSEHQTGLALDIVAYGKDDFENTEEFNWLKENAHLYGFILRFPKGKEYLTGYNYEPWHYRYLGVDLATKVYNSGLTYEEYYAYYGLYKGEF